jgi:RND family efflux transporter MFP subunit
VNQTIVKTKVAGELRELTVREGMTVKRGQVLGRIDAAEYEVRVRERDAQLKAVDSQVDQARRTLDNTRQLQERNFVSQSALDQARSGFDVAVGNRDAVSAQLALARKSLADAALIAPIDGVVLEVARVTRGSVVHPVVFRLLAEAAKRLEIPYSVHAAGRFTSTDADSIHLTRDGVATALLSIPNRYMHSPNELVSLDDLDRAAEVIAETCRAVTADTDFTAR